MGLIDDRQYLDTPEQWDELAERLEIAGIFGLDTEFYNVDVRKQSTVGRARVHVWSVAIRTARQSPLGYHRARGWVLPAAALEHPALKAVLEDPFITKCVHNQPVDDHAIHNHGVNLRGCINTLDLARWAWPELVSGSGFGLKALMATKLHRNPICEYGDVVRDVRTVEKLKERKVKESSCSCGVSGCRKRKGHEKTTAIRLAIEAVQKEEKFEHPLESIVPGHKRFDLLVRYAAEDAIAALEIEELAQNEDNPAPFPVEWMIGKRPLYNQAVVNELVLMERRGFGIDTAYCTEQAAKAEADEAKELDWLYRWYCKNVDENVQPEEVDPVWSSPKQLCELFDELEFPRSPVWKKGRVKRDEVKLDATALEWIAKADPRSKQVIKHLLHLKRIRSGKKYLVKMRDSGGWVNPICGPAGDSDDRNGAVTGRIGIKGVLEAQQLPTREEADLYQIRKAIIPDAGKALLVADYSALEVVILADLCKRLFNDTQLEGMVLPGAPDIHVENAKMVFGGYLGWTVPKQALVEGKLVDCKYVGLCVDQIPSGEFKKHPYGAILRGMIKTVWYGLQYGKGAYGFSTLVGPDGNPIGEEVAGKMLKGIELAVPGPFKWQAWCRDFVNANHGIYSLGGRWCPLYAETSPGAPDWMINRAYRRAYNFPIQASAAELIGDAMIRVGADDEFKWLGFDVRLQVHDELVACGPLENMERAGVLLKKHMEAATANGTKLIVPLQVSVGNGPELLRGKVKLWNRLKTLLAWGAATANDATQARSGLDTEFTAEVVRITQVLPHPNADRLQIARFEMKGVGETTYEVVIQSGSFQPGDLATYFSVDCILPTKHPEFAFLTTRPDGAGKEFYRLRAASLRGVFSQGLLVPAPKGSEWGAPMAEEFGVTYYRAPEPEAANGPTPTSSKPRSQPMPVYGVDSLKKLPRLFEEGEPVCVTEKIHGTNFRFGWVRKRFLGIPFGWKFVVGSHRTIKGKNAGGYYGEDVWTQAAEKYNLAFRVRDYKGYIFYGELYGYTEGGKKIQDLTYGRLPEHGPGLAIFDIQHGGKWLHKFERTVVCADCDLETVPVVYVGEFDPVRIKKLAEGGTLVGKNGGEPRPTCSFYLSTPAVGTTQIREGVVVESLEGPRRKAKYVGEGYLMRKDG